MRLIQEIPVQTTVSAEELERIMADPVTFLASYGIDAEVVEIASIPLVDAA